MAARIEDYGIIGNGRTAALVAKTGAIDWLCAPDFDSDACFAALLGYDEHGRWSIRPTVAVRSEHQRYRGDTMVLETELACDGGSVLIIDFMPYDGRCDVVRIIEGLEGEVPMQLVVAPVFGYGANTPAIELFRDGVRFTAGPDRAVLRAALPLDRAAMGGGISSYFRVKKGDRIATQLCCYPSHLAEPPALDAFKALDETERFWREWAGRCVYHGRWRDAVLRSLLTLKALTYSPTGAIVAAPTTSLPEELGGVRNWDYRYCWLRDASLTIDALMIGGYVDEAKGFRDWLVRAIAGSPNDIQIMYDLFGARRLSEFELDWLPGYEGSRPVRVGNAASKQFQLDVYGEVFSAFYAALKRGLPIRQSGWPVLREVLEFLDRAWQRPDDGIWEVRGGRRHFTHSKVFGWVAIDRAVKAIEEFGIGGEQGAALLPRLHGLRERIHEEVLARGFHPGVGAFTQSYGSETLDASLLTLPHVGFLPASDPRMVGTVAAIERGLLRDGFVLRYDTMEAKDGLPGVEGAFLACSFWLADNYAYAGRLAEAEALFERLLGLRNHLGLLAEEYDPRLERQIGNFPQGFSHLALIVSAQLIDSALTTGKASLGDGAQPRELH